MRPEGEQEGLASGAHAAYRSRVARARSSPYVARLPFPGTARP